MLLIKQQRKAELKIKTSKGKVHSNYPFECKCGLSRTAFDVPSDGIASLMVALCWGFVKRTSESLNKAYVSRPCVYWSQALTLTRKKAL